MAFTEVKPSKPQLKADKLINGDITGLIDLRGKNVDGWMALSFQKATILGVVKRMLGDELSDIDDSVEDCVGEIVNMVTGGAKVEYAKLDLDVDMARPIIIVGSDRELECSQPGKSIVLPFHSDTGDLTVEFFIK